MEYSGRIFRSMVFAGLGLLAGCASSEGQKSAKYMAKDYDDMHYFDDSKNLICTDNRNNGTIDIYQKSQDPVKFTYIIRNGQVETPTDPKPPIVNLSNVLFFEADSTKGREMVAECSALEQDIKQGKTGAK